MTKYAARTEVPVERSREEIERTLSRYGAEQFLYGWDSTAAVIAFVVTTEGGGRRQVRFRLPVPDRNDRLFTHHSHGLRTAAAAERQWNQAQRAAWRALALVVKAKLEAVESGIATFEDEFLSYIMLPSGETVGDWMAPQLNEVYESGEMPGGLRLALGAPVDV